MKAFTLMALLALSVLGARAQEDAIQKYFGKYSNDDRFTSVYISGKMFNLFSGLADTTDKDVREAMRKLDGLRILNSDNVEGKKMYDEAHRLLVTNGFQDLVDVKENNQSEFKFLIREVNGKIHELLLLSGEYTSFSLISLVGDIDLKQISKLSKGILHVDAFGNLGQPKDAKTKSTTKSK